MSLLSRDLNIGNLLDEIQVLKERIAILERTAVQLTSSKFILDHLNLGYDGGASTGELVASGDIRLTTGGIYVGQDADPGDGDVAYTGDLAPYRNATAYTGYVFVPLTTPLTSTSWDGDAYSATAKTLIDLSSVFGAPAGIKAALFYVVIRDSGSAANDCYILLAPDNTAFAGLGVDCSGLANDSYERAMLTVPCDSNGDVYYQIAASGASTMDVILRIWGYWI